MYREVTSGPRDWQRKVISNDTSHEIHGLNDGVEYLLQVMAVNNEHLNSSTDIIGVHTSSHTR